MKKKIDMLLILTTSICLLPIVLSTVLYPELPGEIPVHFNIAGQASNYLPKAFADFVESVAVHKFNRNDKIILLYSDYSALQIDAETKSVESVDDVTNNLIEIVARLLQYQNNPADIPAYLWRDLREWLRNHG